MVMRPSSIFVNHVIVYCRYCSVYNSGTHPSEFFVLELPFDHMHPLYAWSRRSLRSVHVRVSDIRANYAEHCAELVPS